MIKAVAKLFIALNGNVKKSQLAAGFAWGVLLGLIPAGNAFWLAMFLVSFFFRHNHGAKIFGMALIKLISPLIIYGVHEIGFFILSLEALAPFFTALFNMPFIPFTKFNNTLVMGGLALGMALWLPVFFMFIGLIPVYRKNLSPKIRESKIIKNIARFPLFNLIEKALNRN